MMAFSDTQGDEGETVCVGRFTGLVALMAGWRGLDADCGR
jgi:hypothetical protein